jgi:enoyl-CoA hydratase/carnithine racemase
MQTGSGGSPTLATMTEAVLTIRLNRPHRRNAIDSGLRQVLLDQLDGAPSQGARAIVLLGDETAFSAGADIKESGPREPVETIRHMRISTQRLIREIVEHPLPIIAGVQGACVGFGVSIALAADFCIAAPDARFIPAFSDIGLAADGAVATTLTRAVGVVRARRFLLLGEEITGLEAAEFGLIHATAPSSDVPDAAVALAKRLGSLTSGALSATKALIHRATAPGLDGILAEERALQSTLVRKASSSSQ